MSHPAPVSDWLGWWLASVMLLVAVGVYCDRSAAMRGTKGQPPPYLMDKFLRLFFLTVSCAPLCLYLPWLTLALLAYLPSYLDGSEKNGGRPNAWVRSWGVWGWFQRRLGLSIVVDTPIEPLRQHVIGLHPHGILPFGGMVNFASDVSNARTLLKNIEIRTLAASFVFYIPLYRDLALAGGICDASRFSARALLDGGKSILLVPGGATEALYAKPGANTLVLSKRLGFIKLAMQSGAYLVPAYSFGENNTYSQLSSDYKVVHWMKTRFQRIFGISLPLITNIVPMKCRVTTVIGGAIRVEKNTHPTDDEIRVVLKSYIEALQALFDKYKDKYDPDRKEELVIL